MGAVELKNKIYWVGAVDYHVRDFHGYVTPHGTTYNAYLILDKKITLVDTVKKGFEKDLLRHIAQIVDPSKIDYLIVNHVEMDHSGAILEVLKAAPGAKIFCSAKGREGLIKHYEIEGRDFGILKTGDELDLGGRRLRFLSAPMIHWPDSMFTYCVEDKVLLPNDGFGQHLASPKRFADEVGEDFCMEEAAKYYANILMPLGSVILKKIQEFLGMNLPVDMIGPSHGAIWRKDTGRIVKAYMDWAVFKATEKIVIVYDSMWESTDLIARQLCEHLTQAGIEVKIFSLRKSDGSVIVRHCLDASVILIGSPTLNGDMFWTMGGFLTYLRGLKPQNKKVGIFGSYGWAGGASKAIKGEVEAMGLGLIAEPFEVQYVPHQKDFELLKDFSSKVAAAARISG